MTCKFENSGPHRLTCRAVRKLLQAFTRRHVPCAMCHQSTHDRHHRRSGVLARRMVPRRARSDQPFGRYSRKCLDTHTDRQTRPGQLFFTDPPEEIFVHRTFNAKAFERSFTTILDNMHAPQCLSERLLNRSSVSSGHTRATENMQLELPRVRTEHARKFVGYRACSLWNSLPGDVRDSRTSAVCRKRCRKFLNAS